ncbi:right-handed parallel beta-helix repeat-containing protein [Cohnella candidum]|uniref:Pectate lyase superfamily protein domain-containing protein n=1 Tax=Cohnella candidum TaxID=2674991 RepID=A0A3G3K014_9BACL|nr:right-handed parallel beta-helix repeat-containing protein [Cohnella candidum]AYQ73838.1 hypothetical protein EAV92_15375 [Cohnella candidum]
MRTSAGPGTRWLKQVLKIGLAGLAALLFLSYPTVMETKSTASGTLELAVGPAAGKASAKAPLPSWGPERDIPAYRVSVRDFGAKGDGKADDTLKIQAAVDSVGKHGGGVVYFPNGVYKVSESIVVKRDLVALEGEGWGAELRMVKHPKRVVTIQGSRDNVVRNLKISLGVANAVRNDQDVGVYVTSAASNFMVENVFGEGKGIMVRGSVVKGTIRNNRIQNTLADGIHLTGGSRFILVTGNELSHTGDDSIAVVSYESQKALTMQVVIADNRVRNSLSRGIAHVGGYQVEIRGNVIEGTSSSGILVDRDGNYQTFAPVLTTIEGNTVTGAGTYGVRRGNQFGIEVSKGASYVTISDNSVTGSKTRGISVIADRTSIRNNVSSGNGDSGIQVGADDVVVAGNLIEKNGIYGFFAEDSDRLRFTGNRLTDNNTRNRSHTDNFLLADSDDSEITGNVSVETRKTMRIERSFELTGSCKGTVFEKNQSQGTMSGAVVTCKP